MQVYETHLLQFSCTLFTYMYMLYSLMFPKSRSLI